MEIKEIDGSQGEGGGQILRTSLSLSACTGQAVRIINIRSGRKKPGLMHQHLACVKAVAEVCHAHVKGASIGSKSIEFVPGQIHAGEYHFSIGSAGSSCLVFQTVLPALLLTRQPSKLTFSGGTHNPLAPSYDFLCAAFLPMLAKMGLRYHISIKQYGFFPVGGGQWSITLTPPQQYRPLTIETRGQLLNIQAKCIGAGVPEHVMQREKKKLLARTGWSEETVSAEHVTAIGAGNIVIIAAHYPTVCAVVEQIGTVNIPAEKVALYALNKFRKYQQAGAPVGEYLADQLLLPLAVTAGGEYVTGRLSEHTRTNIAVLKQLCNRKISSIASGAKQCCKISIARC